MANDKPVTFELGRILATPGVIEQVSNEEVLAALARHSTGDWGDVDDEDKAANDDALRNGGRLFSRYASKNGTRFWIISEADRSATILMLPGEY